jgi:hypothetical protein
MKPYYFMWSLFSMNAWVWSSVFHTRGELCMDSLVVVYLTSLLQIYLSPKSLTIFRPPWPSGTASITLSFVFSTYTQTMIPWQQSRLLPVDQFIWSGRSSASLCTSHTYLI